GWNGRWSRWSRAVRGRPLFQLPSGPLPADPPLPPVDADQMRRFWNDRAREDAFYFVDTRQRYRAPEPERFWDAEPLVDYLLAGLGVELDPTSVTLEIGCGLGRITRVLSARSRRVLALDVS